MAKSSATRIRDSRMTNESPKERFRGSSDLPLTSQGASDVTALAKEIAKKGGLDIIYTPRLKRNRRTAEIIAKYTGAKVNFDDDLVDWRMGGLEGQPVDAENIEKQNDYIKNMPDEPIPGQGPLSTKPGESFNSFRDRGTSKDDEIIDRAMKMEKKRIAYIVNFRFIKLTRAYAKAGLPKDHHVDTEDLISYFKTNDMKPASIERVHIKGDTLQLEAVDIFAVPKLDGNTFLIRHGQTPWNKPKGDARDEDE